MTQLEMELPLEKPWLSEWVGDTLVIYPLGDRGEHTLGSENCDCRPQVETAGAENRRMIVHNAGQE